VVQFGRPIQKQVGLFGSIPWRRAILAAWICLCCTLSGRAYTLFDYQIPVNLPFSDVLSNPNDHLHWNNTTITYSFDPTFNSLFPDARIKDQIRLALATWSNASAIGYGPTFGYAYFDSLEMPAFADIRSITLHELGHALGLGHPGPSSNPGAGSHYNLNFIEVPGGGNPSTLTQVSSSQPANSPSTEVMYAYFSSGEYRRILTWDELDAYAYVYGNQVLTFTEVPNNGNIVFKGYSGPPGNFAVTAVAGVQGNVASGSVITSATISYNVTPPIKLGYQTHGINWSCQNNLFKVHRVVVRTHGTDNLVPDAYWDNNYTPYVFNSGGPPSSLSAAGAGLKNDVIWSWTLPGITSATDIPTGTIFHPGLALDANNWSVANSQCFDISGTISSTLPLSVADYMDNAVVAFPLVARDGVSGPDEHALTYYFNPTNFSCGRGFSIIASDAPSTAISHFQYADVTGMGLSLSNLNLAGLEQLQTNGLVVTVTNFGSYDLASNQRFVLLLSGGTNCLPSDVIGTGNYLIMNRPDLLTRELFLAWQSTNSENVVQNFALLGEPPTGSLPALAISPQTGGTNAFLVTWPAPSTGFTLQQNPDLTTSNWVAAPSPIVAMNPGLGVYQNQVVVSSTGGHMFYRLVSSP
jgi:hypothetical protein